MRCSEHIANSRRPHRARIYDNWVLNILAVLCIAGSLQAQWTDPARNRKIAVTVAAHGPQGSPVVLFFPAVGYGIGTYRAFLQSLSGYTVVFVQPQYALKAWQTAGKLSASAQLAFERQEMKEWVKDGLFVLGRMKVPTAGVLGHGAGGLAAAAACQLSREFHACLDMDGDSMGSPFLHDTPFDQPFLWLKPLRDAPVPPTAAELKDRQMTQAEYEAIMAKSGPAAMWKSRSIGTMVTLYAKDADHESFTSRRAGTRAFDLSVTVVQQFFDEQLRGRPSPLFGGYATGYPEIVFQQFRTLGR
jgi:hypothetical protein